MGHLDFDIVSDFASLGPLHLSRALYKSTLFMQNEANFRKSQMNVNLYNTTAYENKSDWTPGENEPNQSQSKPISKTEVRRQKTDDRRQKAEDRRQKIDDRRQKAECGPSGLVPAKRGPLAMTCAEVLNRASPPWVGRASLYMKLFAKLSHREHRDIKI